MVTTEAIKNNLPCKEDIEVYTIFLPSSGFYPIDLSVFGFQTATENGTRSILERYGVTIEPRERDQTMPEFTEESFPDIFGKSYAKGGKVFAKGLVQFSLSVALRDPFDSHAERNKFKEKLAYNHGYAGRRTYENNQYPLNRLIYVPGELGGIARISTLRGDLSLAKELTLIKEDLLRKVHGEAGNPKSKPYDTMTYPQKLAVVRDYVDAACYVLRKLAEKSKKPLPLRNIKVT